MDDNEWNALTEEEQQRYMEELLEKHLSKYEKTDLTKGRIVARRDRNG